ncbi:MAG: glycoside hydrolase family 97 protein [Bacteroidales bacterium]|nr:glycoside hydrolase family 97 protein [Bacteroidales bacterium]
MRRLLSVIVLCALATFSLGARDYVLSSPDGTLKIKVSDGPKLVWSVQKSGATVMDPSEIALDVKDHGRLGPGSKVVKLARREIDQKLTAVVPTKFREVRDRCNEMTLRMRGGWYVVFRAYDNGAAYRFATGFEGGIEVLGETSEWRLPSGSKVYWANEKNPDYITHCEAFFKEKVLDEVGTDTYSFLPMSVKTPEGIRVVITETDLLDYPNMMLRSAGGGVLAAEFPHVIDGCEMRTDRDVTVTMLADCIARTQGARAYPWRILCVGSDRDLLENTLAWQLASPEEPGDWSWLKPGKISWEWWSAINVFGVDFKAGVNTDTYKYFIDFAAKYGLEYILLDEGWSASTLNIVEAKPDLDLQALIDYGKSKGVGVVLWTLWTPMMRDLENILDVYAGWGVAGIKVDFMQMQDQNMVNFYERVARECAKRKLLVDYHGAYKPAGLQRKYPNAMTFEGVHGMEHDKDSADISPDHDMVLPFTRMVAGPMDYTPGAVNNATKDDYSPLWYHPMSQGTRSHQVALFVSYESPLMMLCDTPSKYYQAPEYTEYLAQIPTIWEETVAQEAEAGEYLLMSRKTSDGRWYSAGLTNWSGRELTLDTSFLGGGQWEARIHKDGVNADVWAEDYKIETVTVTAGDQLPVVMAKGGGWVAEFVKK